jgi:hypothetical protein
MRRIFLPVTGLALIVLIMAGGCTKRVLVDTDEVDISDGRPMELNFSDGSVLEGRMVRGSPVRYTRNDSLFEADVHNVEDGFIELSQQKLITDLDEWTELRRLSEQVERKADRTATGGSVLMVDDITTVKVIERDNRRTVTEALFWTAAVLTVGYAAFTP